MPIDGPSLFWQLAEPLLTRPDVEKGTMMGFPCLRRQGRFFACLEHRTGDLIIKVDRQLVGELIEDGVGQSFSPAGRVFKEWVLIPKANHDSWAERLEEAWAFAAS